MEERELKEKIEQGFVLARIIIEIVGKPKEHVEKALDDLMGHMRKNKDVVILREHKEEAKEVESDAKVEEGMWATFTEVEVLIEGLNKLVGFCFDYMPSSIEILEPENFKLNGRNMASFLNEMQAKLHNLGIAVKQLKNENLFLKKNSANLLLNHLTTILVNAKRTIEAISKLTGISSEEIKPFLDKLIKDGKVKQEGDYYTFAKNE